MAHTITNYPSGIEFIPSQPSDSEVQQISPTNDCNAGVVALFNSVKVLSDTKADTSSLATVATSGSYNNLSDKPVSYITFTVKGTVSVSQTDDLATPYPLFNSGTFVAEQVIVGTAPGTGGFTMNIYLNGQPLAQAGLISGQKSTVGGAGYFNPGTFQAGDYLTIGCFNNNSAKDLTVVVVVQYT
jgi:hypothetical protein